MRTRNYIFGSLALGALVLTSCTGTKEYLDRSVVPEAKPAATVNIGKAEEFTLDNGLKVIVVENHKLPRVSFQLRIDRPPMIQGNAVGMTGMVGPLLRAGTKNRSKDLINEEVDFIGASFNVSSGGIFASSLKKHSTKLLEVMTDVLMNPIFPEEELEKEKSQAKSGLQASLNNPNAIAGNVGDVLRYSKRHPYGEVQTEETIDNITIEMIRTYYENFFIPNISYLVVVGDITPEEAKTLAEKHFGPWETGVAPKSNVPNVKMPKARKVAVVDRPGAVQSVIHVTYPVEFKPGSDDAIAARVMNEILGGHGFSARLIQNLREDKAYTYGAYSELDSDRYMGSFTAHASVRNEVTDSAVDQFLFELNRIINEQVEQEKLDLIKNKLNGTFSLSLESPQTVASMALNKALYDLPADYYDTYLDRLSKITREDIQRVAKKFIQPKNAYILVVGNQSEVAEKLARFADDGEVLFLDAFGDEAAQMEAAPDGVTVATIMADYIKALGGEENINKIKSLKTIMDLEIAGAPMKMTRTVLKKNGSKYLMTIEAMGQVFQKTSYNGTSGKNGGPMGTNDMTEDELEGMKNEAQIVPELNFESSGSEFELMGVVDGQYKIKITAGSGDVSYEFYDQTSHLKTKSIGTIENPQGGSSTVVSEISKYEEVEGVQFPAEMTVNMGPQAFSMKSTSVLINPDIDDSEFE